MLDSHKIFIIELERSTSDALLTS